MVGELDLKDRKILYQLDLNARQTDNQIAKKVGLSRDSVRYRITRLVEKEYISYFMTLLNSMKLGYDWYRTFFKFQNLTLEKEEDIINWLKQRASWMSKVEGVWDINTGIFCKNVYEYRDIINAFFLKYSKYIERYDVAIVTREWSYHRDYLLNKNQKTTKPQLMGFNTREDYKIEKIDEIDYKILKVLIKNARMKTIDIARKIRTTEIIVRYRIKKLIKKGIIIGFRPFLNIQKFGDEYFKIHFTLQNINPERKDKIISYINQHPKIIRMTELVGGADIEMELQVKNNEELHNCIREIRSKFGDIIRDYEFMQYTKEYKYNYLPEIDF